MDITSKSIGDELTATEFNQIPNELENAIVVAGLVPSDSNLTQIAKAITQLISDADFYSTGGSANAITLSAVSPRIAPASLTNGAKARFIASTATT